MGKEQRLKTKKKTEKVKKEKPGTMDIILIIVGASLLIFTITMIRLFTIYGSIPDTLVTCVFAALGGECGIMGWIKTNKDKSKDREWQLEDEQRQQEHIKDLGGDDTPRCDL